MDRNILIELKHLSALQFNGEGAIDLLQGQITCDVQKISTDNSCLAALCNAKGKVVSSFLACKLDTETYCLIGDHDALIKTRKELEKYSPFYKVEMNLNDKFIFLAIDKETLKANQGESLFSNQNTIEIRAAKYFSYLDKRYALVCCQTEEINLLKKEFKIKKDNLDWDLDELLFKNVEINAQNSGLYTPHQLNYDLNNRVDFEKGCYTGQEIVARMHYRSKNLPRLSLAETDGQGASENMAILDAQDKKIGTLVKAVHLNGRSMCLVSVKERNLSHEKLKIREIDSEIILI